MKFPGRHTRPCVQVWLPLSSSVPVGRGSCRGTPSPRGEGRAHQYQAPFCRPGDAVWSLSPAHSCSLPPRDLTARLCLTLSVASCGPAGAPCPGPASHPPDYARAPVPLTTRCSVLPSLPRMTFLPAPLPPSPATPPRPRTRPPPGPARPVICASLLPNQHLPRTVLASTRCACQGRCPPGGWGRGGGRRLGFQPWLCLDSELDAA